MGSTVVIIAVIFVTVIFGNGNLERRKNIEYVRQLIRQKPIETPRLRVFNHRPCNKYHPKYNGPWKEIIKFSSKSHRARVVPDYGYPGCYRVVGTVDVRHRMYANNLQVFVEIKQGMQNIRQNSEYKLPVPCRDAVDGCGGYGSCLYCGTCEDVKDGRVHNLTRASVQVDGKPLKCRNIVEQGLYTNVSLRFCLPPKEEFLKSGNVTEQVWDEIVSNKGGLGTYITLYIFTTRINQLFRSQLDLLRQIEQTGQSLSTQNYYNLPFNDMLWKRKTGYVGCHEIFGSIYEEKNQKRQQGGRKENHRKHPAPGPQLNRS